ncbi:MAG: hypothetical protein ABFC24_01125 [Methanoregulaceae archaeon]
MWKRTGLFILLVSLLATVTFASAADPWVEVENSSSVEFWEGVTPGQVVTSYVFLGFHQDFITDQNLTFTTELEDASWNYSIYLKEPSTYSVDWFPQPKVSGNTLVIESTNDTELFYDAVKVEVKGKVPQRVTGSDLVLEKAVRYDNISGTVFDTFVLNRTITNGTPVAPSSIASPSVAITTAKPTTRKSPVGIFLAVSALIACAALIASRDRTRK